MGPKSMQQEARMIEEYAELQIDPQFRALKMALNAKNGNQLARALGVSRQAVSQAKITGRVPLAWFEKAGLSIYAKQIRDRRNYQKMEAAREAKKARSLIRAQTSARKISLELKKASHQLVKAALKLTRAIRMLNAAQNGRGDNDKGI